MIEYVVAGIATVLVIWGVVFGVEINKVRARTRTLERADNDAEAALASIAKTTIDHNRSIRKQAEEIKRINAEINTQRTICGLRADIDARLRELAAANLAKKPKRDGRVRFAKVRG